MTSPIIGICYEAEGGEEEDGRGRWGGSWLFKSGHQIQLKSFQF